MAYDKFLSSGKIGNLELKNRSVFPPMGTAWADKEGFITQRLIDYHVRRVEGGCAMNIVEIASVHITSYNYRTPGIWDDKFLPGLTKLAHAIKDAGGVACIQLWHGGRQQSGHCYGGEPWAPSPIACPWIQQVPHEMTKEDIKEIVSAFGDAAERAKKAGFDAVELHGAHNYLIDEFLNSYSNHRTDEYGGSLENRARFAIEIIRDVKEKCGEDYPLIMRMVGSENVPDGVTIEDAVENAKMFEAAGCDALDVSQGSYTSLNWTVPPYFYPKKTNAKNAGIIRKNVSIPIICAGRILTPDMAEEILQDGQADFISLGRIQLCDPDFVKKAAENRPDDIVHCISCNSGCVENMFTGDGASCIFRPATGRETEQKLVPATEDKTILTIGGGMAGLEAARVAAERGYKSILFEKSARWGGQFLTAGKAPHKEVFYNGAVEMGYRAMKAGVDVRLNTEANKERILELDPDYIVVATGSEPFIPEIEHDPVMPMYEARSFLDGESHIKEENILVIGGGLTGLEVAEVLTEQGKTVTVIDMLPEIGIELEIYIRPYMMGYIAEHGIKTFASTVAVSIEADHVVTEVEGKERKFECDAVVWACGSTSESKVAEMIKELGIEYAVVGDADEPGKVKNAIWDANAIARSI